MESLIDELRVAAKRLLGFRVGLCISAVAVYGYLVGSMLSRGVATNEFAAMALLGAAAIAAAAFAMSSAELHAERQRKRKLDALYGRDSSS